MSDISVRAANTADVDAIHEIFSCPGVVRETSQLPYVSLDKRKEQFAALGPDDHRFVAEIKGRVIGTLMLGTGKDRRSHVGGLGRRFTMIFVVRVLAPRL